MDICMDPPAMRHSYKYLGFVFHVVRIMPFGAGFLVAAARKALLEMRRQCASLGIRDSAVKCKLFATSFANFELLKSYGYEVWAVNIHPKTGRNNET